MRTRTTHRPTSETKVTQLLSPALHKLALNKLNEIVRLKNRLPGIYFTALLGLVLLLFSPSPSWANLIGQYGQEQASPITVKHKGLLNGRNGIGVITPLAAVPTYGKVSRVLYNQEAGILKRLCYYYDPASNTCKADRTTITASQPPLHGTLRNGVLVEPVGDGGFCNNFVLPYDVAYYTWTDTPSLEATQQDSTTLSFRSNVCSGNDFDLAVTIQLNKSPKNLGQPDCPSCMEGNPINAATGNKFQTETDYQGPANTGLEFKRYYNSQDLSGSVVLGNNWHSTYHRGLTPPAQANDPVKITGADGRVDTFKFNAASGTWLSEADVASRLGELKDADGVRTGWQLVTEDDDKETYSPDGRLLSIITRSGQKTTLGYGADNRLSTVTGPFGHTLGFSYDSATGLLQTMRLPDTSLYQYGYGNYGNLTTVTYPDLKIRTYLYENSPYVEALTGIIDEENKRFATFNYDSQGLATSSEHAGGVEKTTITYNSDGTSDVIDPYLNLHSYSFVEQFDLKKPLAVTGQPVPTMGSKAASYDADGNVKSRTDFNNNKTCYAYDLNRNLEIARIEGLAPGKVCPSNIITYILATGTVERKILTTWHNTYRLPTAISEPKRLTTFVYHGDNGATCGNIGVLCNKTVTATTDPDGGQGFAANTIGLPRVWSYTYNNLGEISTIDGPRTDASDTTAFLYYTSDASDHKKGDLRRVTDAAGNITTYNTYNLNGSPTRITDDNGLVTDLLYDSRNRLHTVTVSGRTTTLEYKNNLPWQVITPNQGTIEYSYDDAHRLAGIKNGAGESIAYTLDNFSKPTKEQTFAAGSTTAATTVNRQFDALGRLWKVLNAVNQLVETNLYDKQGNLLTQTGKVDANIANDRLTQFGYDDLNRLETVTDAINGLTTFTYDGLDHTVNVEDPSLHSTAYTIDGLDNLQQETSPDRGTRTNNSVIDAAGIARTAVDARNHSSQYVYDALNRVTSVSYDDFTSASYQYDFGIGASGQLNHMGDATGFTDWQFDTEGRLLSKTQTVTGTVARATAYSYNTATGRLETMTYPSGAVLKYTYDGAGRPLTLSYAVNASSPFVTLLDTISYQPLGGLKSYRLASIIGTPSLSWGYDGNGRIKSYPAINSAGALSSKSLLRDRLGNVITLGDTGSTANDQSYIYDKLGRLTNYNAPALAAVHGYGYDGLGNRETKTVNGVATTSIVNANSNRLDSVGTKTYSHDASGNLTNNGTQTFTYDAKGRLSGTSKGANTYSYGINALGQRVSKASAALSTGGRVYVYDEAGHLIGEYDTTGVRTQEHVWLEGRPVFLIGAAGGVYPVFSDHLGTPRQVTDTNNLLRWAWDNADPFGANAANVQPTPGQNRIDYNLRFPGQYYDSESGLHYNVNRDYDPKLGRYYESDPIGIAGGLNTYGYVNGNPISWIDPLGLVEGSPNNIFKRISIDELALGYKGSTMWCFACRKGNFPKNTNKCNKFVYDVTTEAGARPLVKGRQPLASEWATPSVKIPNWRSLNPSETPQPGDVAAYKLPDGGTSYSGHTGIITSDESSNISAHDDAVYPVPDQFSGNPNTNYRRYTGE